MESTDRLDHLRQYGRMQWLGQAHGWRAEPDDVVNALSEDGFEEYKRDVARSRREGGATGGVWQGLNYRTGAVVSAVWVRRPMRDESIVYIDINGEPLKGS